MERIILLGNGATIGVFEIDHSPCSIFVFVVLSPGGDYSQITVGEKTEVHQTKYIPLRHTKEVMKTLSFRNSFSPHAPYVCSRFHGRTLWNEQHSVVRKICPFKQRVCQTIPVLYTDEDKTGVPNYSEFYCALIQRIHPAVIAEVDLIKQVSARPHSTHAAEALSIFSELNEELELLRNTNFFVTASPIVVESLNGQIFFCSSKIISGNTSSQIWFDVNTEALTTSDKWLIGEIITLFDLSFLRFQKNGELNEWDDEMYTNTTDESSLSISGMTNLSRREIDQTFHISVLELECSINENTPLCQFLRRKSEMLHLLALREHNTLFMRQSESRIIPQEEPPALSIQVLHSEHSEFDHSGLFLLSDGRIRGIFPNERLVLEYFPNLRSIKCTLPDGIERLFSVDELLDKRREFMNGANTSNHLREDWMYLLSRRTIQVLSFRRRMQHSSLDDLNQLQKRILLSQHRSKIFLRQVESLLSHSSREILSPTGLGEDM